MKELDQNTNSKIDFLDLDQLELSKRYIQVNEDGKDSYGIKSLLNDLGIKRSELAEYLSKTPQDLQSWVSPSAEEFVHIKNNSDKEKLSKLILLCICLRVKITQVSNLRAWMRLANKFFAMKTPFQLILEGKIDDVIAEILPLATGNVS
jgi:hypothetical protein